MARSYRTLQGDTFDMVAYRVWGREHMAHHIIAANPDYADVAVFGPGVTLTIPDVTPATPMADLPPWYTGASA